MPRVAVMIGSESDRDVIKPCADYLEYFGIESDIMVLSAHRNPVESTEFAQSAEKNGYEVIIAGAGMAAHLPGVVAAHTDLPVIGVPIDASPLGGIDALYSIVQMPPGIPVGTVAIGKAGSKNAAVLAARIIALNNKDVKSRLEEFRNKGFKL